VIKTAFVYLLKGIRRRRRRSSIQSSFQVLAVPFVVYSEQDGITYCIAVDDIKEALRVETESPWLDNLLQRFALDKVRRRRRRSTCGCSQE